MSGRCGGYRFEHGPPRKDGGDDSLEPRPRLDRSAGEAREVEEETGWRVDGMKPLVYAQPANGITDSEHYVFRADGATWAGPRPS